MELNEYNGFDDHCKATENELKRKYIHKESHNLDSIDHIMQRKDQEFIDHALLAPEYMRDPNHFIMDLMNFPKGVTAAHNSNPGDTLPADLHFHNALFPVSADDHHSHQQHQQHHHHHHHHQHHHQHQQQQHHDSVDNHQHHHSNEPRKTPSGVYLPLNSDFLLPVSKTYNTNVDQVESVTDNSVKVVQQLLLTDTNVALDDASIDDDCDISRFNSRKVLPHKKRISRKLKIGHDDSDLQLNVPLEDHKLPHVEQLGVGVGAGVQQFRCELCGHTTYSQLNFFAHLKQHYEPSTPDTILTAMKTSLDALGGQAKADDPSNLCAIDKKTVGLDQVFQDVHFPFENFTQNDDVNTVRVVLDPQSHVERVEMKMLDTAALNEAMSVAASTSALQQHPLPQQPQQTTQNLVVPEEFSDTEDMLEGIRDKVLIEDTCDTMDLMTPTSNGVRPHWFTNTCFNGIDLKTKPFCDVLFSGQFAPLLNTDASLPQENHMSVAKLMPKELVESPEIIHQATTQHPTDLRLTFPHSEATLNHEPQPLPPLPPLPPLQPAPVRNNNVDLIPPHNIKIEDTPDIPQFHSEETIGANEGCEEDDDDDDDDDDDGDDGDDDFVHDNNNQLHDDNHLSDASYSPSPESRSSELSYLAKEPPPDDEDCEGKYDEDNNVEIGENGKPKSYVCSKCQRVFNSCNALKYHHRTHSGLRPHQCDTCGKSFFAVGALKSHTRTHTGDKPFVCEHCNRKFRQWGDLKYHTISIHSNEKNHQCEFCGKAFSRKYSLVVHLRIHTSERNYKCEFCTKTFRASTYLQNHRKIHTGEKPYECDVCMKKFRVSGDLRRHKRIHERLQKVKQDVVSHQETTALAKSSIAPTTT